MNKSSRRQMRKIFKKYLEGKAGTGLWVVDIGSYNVNGSFKDILSHEWSYLGVDIVPGPGVDYVMPNEYEIPLPDGSTDVIISGSCFQYVRNPFKLMKEGARVLKPGGYAFITAPSHEPAGLLGLPEKLTRCEDTFRYHPAGMRSVMKEAGLKVLEAYLNGEDCWGIATK